MIAPAVERMVRDFMPEAFGVITVISRPDGSYNVIDGAHRCATLRAVSDDPAILVPCIVIPATTLEHEAEIFCRLDGGKPLNAIDKFRAAVIWKQPDAVAIRDAVAEICDRRIANTEGGISCVGTLHALHARGVLREALTLASAWFAQTRDRRVYSREVISVLGEFVRRYPHADLQRASKAFSVTPPGTVVAAMRGMIGASAAIVADTMLVEAYNRGLRSGRLENGAAKAA